MGQMNLTWKSQNQLSFTRLVSQSLKLIFCGQKSKFFSMINAHTCLVFCSFFLLKTIDFDKFIFYNLKAQKLT